MADPQRLGKYVIRSVLGKGAMGIVYEGFDPDIERPVAIKTIRKDTIDPELAQQFMARFRNEAKAAGRLHHPNIVGVYEYGEEGAVAFIAMEYVEGTGLREYLNRKVSFEFSQLVMLMSQLLEALEFAHVRGIVHRDIKPANLIVTRDGVLKVADFGIARIDRSNLTTAGMVIGTPSYMSPEQCRGTETDPRSDLFSAGVVFYELLTGHKPFAGSIDAIAYKICHEDPPPPSTVSGLKLPPAVDRLVATALAKDPQARFSSARAFNDALREAAAMPVEVGDGDATTVVSLGAVMLQVPAPPWDDAVLDTAEHELARAIGPMAKMIVRKAAAQTRDREALCAILSEKIPDPATRERFVKAFHHAGAVATAGGVVAGKDRGTGPRGRHDGEVPTSPSGAMPARGTAGNSARAPLDSAYIERITGRLAVYIGPIARIVAKQAAQRAHSREEFVRLVADRIGSQDRAAFLVEIEKLPT